MGIGLGKWKTKSGKTFLGLGKCRDRLYGDQVSIYTAEVDKDGKHDLQPLGSRFMIEEIHKEYVKYFDNEAYQNYEIHDVRKNSKLDRCFKIVRSSFERNKNVDSFFINDLKKKDSGEQPRTNVKSTNVLSEIYIDRVTLHFVFQQNEAQEYYIGR